MEDTTLRGAAPVVRRLVPMAHVRDVEQSLEFYRLLGFVPAGRVRLESGRTTWAIAESGSAEIMFAAADEEPAPEAQSVLFYMYCENIAALREHLLASGLSDGGRFDGSPGPGDGRRVVFEITRPFYMPEGELRIADPDGYCILVGQLE